MHAVHAHEIAGPSLTLVHVNLAWKAVACRNMLFCATVAAEPVHEEMSRLNAEALKNMYVVSVTRDVSQLAMSRLNAEALKNMYRISITREVSQLLMSWLNAEAP